MSPRFQADNDLDHRIVIGTRRHRSQGKGKPRDSGEVSLPCPQSGVDVSHHGSLDHLVGPLEKGRGNGEAEGLGSLEVDHQLELRGLLHQ